MNNEPTSWTTKPMTWQQVAVNVLLSRMANVRAAPWTTKTVAELRSIADDLERYLENTKNAE